MKTLLLLGLSSVCLLCHSGCSTTDYERKPDGTVKLTATSFLVKREIGRINVDEKGATLDGAKTDQSAVAQLLGEALLAKVAK